MYARCPPLLPGIKTVSVLRHLHVRDHHPPILLVPHSEKQGPGSIWTSPPSLCVCPVKLSWGLKLLYQKPGEQSCKCTGSWFREIRGRPESCRLAWGPAYGFRKEVFAMDSSHSAIPLKPHEGHDVSMKVVAVEQLGPSERWCQHGRWTSTCPAPAGLLPSPFREESTVSSSPLKPT